MMEFNQSLTKSEDQKSVPGNVSVSMHVDPFSLIPYLGYSLKMLLFL